MRNIDCMEFEVWYKVKGTSDKARRMCAFHYRYEADEYIETRHGSIKDNYYLKVVGESALRPNEIF